MVSYAGVQNMDFGMRTGTGPKLRETVECRVSCMGMTTQCESIMYGFMLGCAKYGFWGAYRHWSKVERVNNVWV